MSQNEQSFATGARRACSQSYSPLEETVLSELVSEPNSLVTGKNTGIFIVGASE